MRHCTRVAVLRREHAGRTAPRCVPDEWICELVLVEDHARARRGSSTAAPPVVDGGADRDRWPSPERARVPALPRARHGAATAPASQDGAMRGRRRAGVGARVARKCSCTADCCCDEAVVELGHGRDLRGRPRRQRADRRPRRVAGVAARGDAVARRCARPGRRRASSGSRGAGAIARTGPAAHVAARLASSRRAARRQARSAAGCAGNDITGPSGDGARPARPSDRSVSAAWSTSTPAATSAAHTSKICSMLWSRRSRWTASDVVGRRGSRG